MTRALCLLLAATVLLVLGIVSVSIWSIPLGALLILIGGIALVAGVDAVPRHGSAGGPSHKRESTGPHSAISGTPRIPGASADRPTGSQHVDPGPEDIGRSGG